MALAVGAALVVGAAGGKTAHVAKNPGPVVGIFVWGNMPALKKLPAVTLADFRPGDTFKNRIDLSLSGLHRPRRAGINGTGPLGADSIILAGMYEDDVDKGDHIAYAGHGGRDQKTGKQIMDQVLDGYNAALIRNVATGHPVRLIRGATLRNEHAPAEGYRYEGLFRLTSFERIRGKSGFWIWLFQLERVPNL